MTGRARRPRGSALAVAAAILAGALAAIGCADLQLASRRALFDASLATPQTQEAWKRAQKAVDEIDAEDERAVGEAVALRIIAGTQRDGKPTGLLLADRELASYVANVGNLVALQGHRALTGNRKTPRTRARRFVFCILDTDDVGAFSTPGGYVFVTRGLLARLESESELAWVLGHEISHVDHEDGLTALKAALGTSTYGGSLVDSLKGRPPSEKPFHNQDFFNRVVDKLAGAYQDVGLARESELTADKTGIEYSTRAGYDGDGANRALEHLQLGHTVGGFLTHGSPGERRAAMGDLLQKPGRTGAARYDHFVAAHVERLAAAEASAPDTGAAAPPSAGGTK